MNMKSPKVQDLDFLLCRLQFLRKATYLKIVTSCPFWKLAKNQVKMNWNALFFGIWKNSFWNSDMVLLL